ncbi:translocator [Nesidiocoris tenuis]|uniref:Translocator n=1 Tax=Nesidiocoris tenuis TaxID=355587 RepID=A0ABN7B2R3_9HEMI|nr:translocator [Nesidiocoris tenuis]
MAELPAIVATLLPQLGGSIVGFKAAREFDSDWQKKLIRAPWSPPGWVFGPMWTALYSGMGFASYLVWRDGNGFKGPAALPLAAYGTQLALNWAWTPLFFGCHSPKWGLIDISLLDVAVWTTTALFYKVNRNAGHLMIPYISWLAIATSLNYYIYKHNPEEEKEE